MYLLVFHAYIKEIHGSRSKIPSKKSRPYIHVSRLRVNVFLDLPQHVSASHCHHQGVVVSSEATQAVCIVDVYGLRPIQSGQLSINVTKRVPCRNRTHCTHSVTSLDI